MEIQPSQALMASGVAEKTEKMSQVSRLQLVIVDAPPYANSPSTALEPS
jgi:hypothetical protein